MIWNWSMDEVRQEQQRVRDYGIDRRGNFKITGMVNTYKAQALRELAKRLVLQEKYRDLLDRESELIDEIEALEAELDILKSRMPA